MLSNMIAYTLKQFFLLWDITACLYIFEKLLDFLQQFKQFFLVLATFVSFALTCFY